MPLTHYALLNTQPRAKTYKLFDGHGCICKSRRPAANGGASSTASADESNASRWRPFPLLR
jgi:hypothetical protein